MALAVVLSNVSARPEDSESIVVDNLNALLRRSGLHLSTASTQLHIMPETVYVVPDDVAAVLSRHAKVLVSNANVHCDFLALSGVLWGHAKEAEDQLDAFLRHPSEAPSSGGQQRLEPYLLALGRALHTLRHADEPFARPEVREAVAVVQRDVEMAIRIAMKLTRVLQALPVASSRRGDVRLARAVLFALSTAELYIATVATRGGLDVAPVLAFMNAPSTWELSGRGTSATQLYCESVRRLIRALFARHSDFAGVEHAAAQLLLRRVAARPPFDLDAFRALHPSREVPLTSACGLLCVMAAVQLCVEDLLLGKETWTAALRRECGRLLREMNEKRQMLSYFQVPVLAALQGMPPVDLTDEAQLRRRADETRLVFGCGGDASVRASVMRLLLAHGHAVREAPPHAAMGRASLLVFAAAVADEVLLAGQPALSNPAALSDRVLRPPVLCGRLVRVAVDAAAGDGDRQKADGVLHAFGRAVGALFDASAAGRSAAAAPPAFRRVAVASAGLVAAALESDALLTPTNRRAALDTLARVYAMRAFFAAADADETAAQRRATLQLLARVAARLAGIASSMTAAALTDAFAHTLLPRAAPSAMGRRNRQEYALLEGYVRAFATPSAALAMDEATMLRHWVETALRCVTNELSGALATAGVDLLVAAFLSRRPIAPLFVATYVALLVPIVHPPRYGEPPLFLVRHFAKGVRAACQALEECDERALMERLHNPHSALAMFIVEERTSKNSRREGEGISGGRSSSLAASDTRNAAEVLENVRPISSVLLIVSALFDKACILLSGQGSGDASRQDRHARFNAYFSALVNLLRCQNSAVLRRVCASVEAVVLEHLHGVTTAQAQWMKYIGSVVDVVQGSSKKSVAEWFLALSERTKGIVPQSHL